MVRFRVKLDIHRPVFEVDLLVSLGAALAIGTPTKRKLFLGFLRFIALEVIFENELAAFLALEVAVESQYEATGEYADNMFHGFTLSMERLLDSLV